MRNQIVRSTYINIGQGVVKHLRWHSTLHLCENLHIAMGEVQLMTQIGAPQHHDSLSSSEQYVTTTELLSLGSVYIAMFTMYT